MRQSVTLVSALALLTLMTSVVAAQATYQVTFDSPWSPATHPSAYPSAAHFSPVVGATHDTSVSYWEPGGIASSAIEQMAETGGTTQLRNLVNADINSGGAGELVFRNTVLFAPGSLSTSFTATAAHPLLTLVTMVAPSPDWFVGVHGLDLRANGEWVDSLTIDLETYDSGTDAGVNFTSPNSDVTPHQPIALLGAPLGGLPPIASFTFTRTSSSPLCDLTGDDDCDIGDLNQFLSIGPIANGVAVSGSTRAYDLNGDDVIDLADRDLWLAGAAAENGLGVPYSAADANLDAIVDGQDFDLWSANKFSSSLLAAEGDFNGDGLVNGRDFLLWNADKTISLEGVSVPEPQTAFLWCCLTAFGWRSRLRLAATPSGAPL